MSDTPQYDWQRDDYRRFDIGEVISRAFRLLRARLADIAALVALLLIGPGIILNASPYFLVGEPDGLTLTMLFIGFVAFIAASVLVTLGLTLLFVRHLWGEHVEMGEAIRQGMSRFWPYVGTALLGAVAVIIGFFALVVPAIILACGWYVIAPVVAGERLGGVDALKRSWSLTRGSKWQIFAVVLVVMVIALVLGGLLGGVGGAFLGLDAVNKSTEASLISVLLFSAIESAAGAVGTVLGLAFVASVYYELLYLKGELQLD